MKIKALRPIQLHGAGEEFDVPDQDGRYLVAIGWAEACVEAPAASRPRRTPSPSGEKQTAAPKPEQPDVAAEQPEVARGTMTEAEDPATAPRRYRRRDQTAEE